LRAIKAWDEIRMVWDCGEVAFPSAAFLQDGGAAMDV
jgi:hypothetical protein